MSEVATYLKMGTTALVLAMIEDKLLQPRPVARGAGRRPARGLPRPVAEAPGDAARRPQDDRRPAADGVPGAGPQVRRGPLRRGRRRRDRSTCSTAGSRCSPGWPTTRCSCRGELDWVAKLELLEGYRDRDGLAWDAPKLQLFDLQYSDVRPERGLYNRLVARGRMERITDDKAIGWAIDNPPEDTRAYFRGRCLRQYARLGRRRVLGLGDLRHPRPRVAAAGAHARAAARHQGARRRPARPLPDRDATWSPRSPTRASRVHARPRGDMPDSSRCRD